MRVTGVPYVQGRNSYADADGAKYGIAIHNTSNDASAEGEASYAQRRTDGISAHFYCDNDSVIQSLDTQARAGHAGSSTGNNNAIAVEITGVNGWSRQTWINNVAWGKLGAALAQVCRAYGIAVRRASVAEMKKNPRVKAFYGHDDMRQAWYGTTHTDPGKNFPWDVLFGAVNAALDPAQEAINVSDFDTTTPFTRPNPEEQDGALEWGTTEPATSYGAIIRAMGWRVWALYKQVKLILVGVQELLARPPAVVQPSDAQWQQFMEHVDAVVAQKIGQVVEASYGGAAFRDGVKGGVAARLDDDPAT